MLRGVLLSVSRNDALRRVAAQAPITRSVVRRFVAGEQVPDAVGVTQTLADQGLLVTLDRLGEDVTDRAQAWATARAYLNLLDALDHLGLTGSAEVSVKLSAVGQALPDAGEQQAYDNATLICERARRTGTTVTLDMEDHTTTDATLETLRRLRADFPTTGAVLQAYLHRTEGDCRDLASAGSRVRLCKGAYDEPESVAFVDRGDIDRSYVRCLKILFSGAGYPMVASHDPRLIDIAGALAVRYGRARGTYEYQMLYGIRPGEQRRLAAQGERMRVYVPYGEDWYGYLVRRMAEKPANLSLFLKSLTSKS